MSRRSTSTARRAIDEAVGDAGTVDYLDVWFISTLVQHFLGPDVGENQVVQETLGSIERLLQSGRLVAGRLIPPGEFDPWPVTPERAMEMIQQGARDLDVPLHPGDIAWFALRMPASGPTGQMHTG